MVVNAHGRPLCKHSRPEWRRRHPGYTARCVLWCEWRTVALYVLLPLLLLAGLLYEFVPRDLMFGFE